MKNTRFTNVFRIIMLICYVLWACFLIFEAAMDGVSSSNQSSNVTEVVVETVNTIAGKEIIQNNEKTQFITRKLIGHFLSFTLLGVFSSLTYFLFLKEKIVPPIILNFVSAFILAALTEFVQSFKDGRSGNFVDVTIDFGGFLVSGILISLIFIISYLKRKKLQNE